MSTQITTSIVDKDRGFRVWAPDELYSTGKPTGFCPNPGDLIKGKVMKMFDEVISVNYAMLTWETLPYGTVVIANGDNPIGGHYPLKSDKYRIYVDTTKNPATLHFHAFLTFNLPDVEAVRVFRGVKDISDTGEILSGYVKNGRVSDTYIPVRPVTDAETETQVLAPLPGFCMAPVEHGEEVTFVAYSDTGVVMIGYARIIKTNLVMALETPARTILDIKLESPFILDPNSNVLTLPIDVPLDDIPLYGKIIYTDGSKTQPVDGSRLKLVGLRNSGSHDTFYISTNAGHNLPLVFSYKLAKGETYIGDGLVEDTIVRDYTAVTEVSKGAYAMKLFAVLRWVSSVQGFRIDYYLYNLTRGTVYDATPHVVYTTATIFDPLLFGVKQRLNVQVDISKVNPSYRPFTFSQSLAVTLVNPGTEMNTNFFIEYLPDGLRYGEDVYAKFRYSNVTFSEVDIKCGATTQAEWLAKLFTASYPLYDRRSEDAAPAPTHFELHAGGKVFTYAVGEWLNKLVIDYKVLDGGTIVIRWICRTPTDELQLGLSPMLAHHIS